MKTCSVCGKEKPTNEYGKQTAAKDGLASRCNSCNREQSRVWYRTNFHKAWAHNTINGHRNKGICFTFSVVELVSWAQEIQCCRLCQGPLDWTPGPMTDASPTLDRIDNLMGEHDLDDVQILCASCNRSKGSRSMEEFIVFCHEVADAFDVAPPA